MSEDYESVNRRLWDDWTGIHLESTFYDVAAFRAGASSLREIEREEVGDVRGRTLLHLQCHFGMDTLSWVREGAVATGADFSPRAIAAARSLAADLDLPARFIESSVYALPDVLEERFDIVYTSYGVLSWLPDLEHWARVVARLLRPGGVLHLVEFHPLADSLGDDGRSFDFPYFPDRPWIDEAVGSYADRAEGRRRRSVNFAHGLGTVVNAVLAAGLVLESLREFPYSPFDVRPFLEESAPGRWTLRGAPAALPLVFAIRARAPAA